MTCYVVTFEISAPAIRASVRTQLQSFSGYCPIHANCWAILTDKTAAQVRDQVMAVMTPTDRVFVVRSGTEAAWRGAYGEENTTWLKTNL